MPGLANPDKASDGVNMTLISNMLFLAVEQKYLHGWKAGDVKILYL
jgi:hypothetical protein